MSTPATEMPATSPSADSGVVDAFSALSPEEQERQREEWKQDLARIEEDIVLMRETLSAKIKEAQELKHKLGITMWSEFTDDVNQGLKNVRESQAYQRTEAALKTTTEKASGLLAGLGAKLTEARDSPTVKSLEERVGTMVTTVKNCVPMPSSLQMSLGPANQYMPPAPAAAPTDPPPFSGDQLQ
ncbi:tumor protein D52-like isoform X15 [Amphibalanus amphitrite]|uniref:tumor protein D52-like isoform X15 n=1 Tax=Amphibalanus amphitrite TaxID=1232801 RepID=UPI001C918814|nr:tumor protein D52-like isoform X15 [Amphibalanus amphitrite]